MPLDDRIKELIAVGASVTANCQPCLEYHVAKARENGACQQEIGEAIEVGRLVRKGAAAKFDRFAPAVLQIAGQATVAPDGDCGSVSSSAPAVACTD